MSYYAHSSYSFSTVASSLKDDRRMLDHLMRTGQDLGIIAGSAECASVLKAGLNDSDVSGYSIQHVIHLGLLRGADRDARLAASEVLDLARGLINSSPDRARSIGGNIAYALANADVISDQNGGQVLDVLKALAGVAESEEEKAYLVDLMAEAFQASKAFRGEALEFALGVAERYAQDAESDVSGCIEMALANAKDGRYRYSYSRLVGSVETLANVQMDRELFARLQGSPLAPALNLEAHILAVSGSDGQFALEYLRGSEPSQSILEMLLHGMRETRTKGACLNVNKALLADESFSERVRRTAALALIINGHKSAVENEATIKAFVDADFQGSGHYERRLEPHALLQSIASRGPATFLPYAYSRIQGFANTSTRVNVDQVREEIIERIGNAAGKWKDRGRLNEELVSSLWSLVQDYRSWSPKAPYAANAEVRLIETGLVAPDVLATVAEGRSRVAVAAKAALGLTVDTEKPAADEAVKKAAGWDATVTSETDFDDYVELAVEAGLSVVAALSLYVTDSRIEFSARRDARRDLVSLLNSIPEFADDIPEKAWTGLSRVRDPLDMSMCLVTRLNGLGGAAAKVGSKNLVKAALF